MKAGFLIDRWQPRRGGAEKALALLASHLEGKNWEVHAFGAKGPREGEDAPGIFHLVKAPGLTRAKYERALGEALVRAAEKEGCEVTVGVRHLPRVGVLWTQNGILRNDYEGKAFGGKRRVFLDFEEALLAGGGARRVVCISGMVREEALRFYPACAERLVLIPNGVDTVSASPQGIGRAPPLGNPWVSPRRIFSLLFPGKTPCVKDCRSCSGPWRLCRTGPGPCSPRAPAVPGSGGGPPGRPD